MKNILFLTFNFYLFVHVFAQFGDSEPCHHNIHCPSWLNNIYKEKISRAVVKFNVIVNGSGNCRNCTGTLVRQWGIPANDQQPLILTAKHCIEGVDLSSAIFYFNYQSPDCDENSVPLNNRGTRCNIASYRYAVPGGATLVDQSSLPDFALLRLNNPIPPHFMPYYAGWTINPVQLTIGQNFTSIHHPAGDIKKVSRTNSISRLTFRLCLIPLPIYPFCLAYGIITSPFYYKIDFWSYGITEPGSSGCALFNSNERIIGMLAFNFHTQSFCLPTQFDNYSAFDMSWAINKGLRDALNPTNVLIGGCNGTEVECYQGDLRLKGEYFPARDYQPNNVIILRAENNIIAADAAAAGLPGVDSLTIHENADFTFNAGGSVILQPGFVAEMGSNFVAQAGVPCSANRQIPEEPEYISEAEYQALVEKSQQALAELQSYGITHENIMNYIQNSTTSEITNSEQILTQQTEKWLNPNVSELHLYPNPAQEVVKIRYSVVHGNSAKIIIYDMYMRVVEEVQVQEKAGITELNITHLPKGVYLCELQTSAQRLVQKLVKE